jgi:hypothetical protein
MQNKKHFNKKLNLLIAIFFILVFIFQTQNLFANQNISEQPVIDNNLDNDLDNKLSDNPSQTSMDFDVENYDVDSIEKNANTYVAEEKQQVKKEIKVQQCFLSLLKKTPQHYSICNDGQTVIDSKTELMWSRCSHGKTWNKENKQCEGKASIHNWQQALAIVKKENQKELLTYNDWRLPNIKELSSLVETSCINPSIDAFTFAKAYNKEVENYDFWTSSVYELYPGRAWHVNFNLGHDFATDKRNYKQVRLVRSGLGKTSYNLHTDKISPLYYSCVTYPTVNFPNNIDVALKTEVISSELEMVFSGIKELSISILDGEYSINNSKNWDYRISKVKNNDIVRVRHTSSSEYDSNIISTLKVGQQSIKFISTTLKEQ